MSPRVIQERAGAGQGSMYHHFAGKADLAEAAIHEMALTFRAGASEWLDGEGTPIERIRSYMLRSREMLKGCQIGGLAHDAEIISNPRLRTPLDETFAWLQGRLAALLIEAQQAGEMAPFLNPDDIASTLVSVIQGSYVLSRTAADPQSFIRAIRGVVALLESSRAGATARI